MNPTEVWTQWIIAWVDPIIGMGTAHRGLGEPSNRCEHSGLYESHNRPRRSEYEARWSEKRCGPSG
jgi:hypothetical protein